MLTINEQIKNLGYHSEIKNGKCCVIYTDNHRKDVLIQVNEQISGVYDPSPFKGSSIGSIIAPCGTRILIKNRQKHSAGISNEMYFENYLTKALQKGSLDIEFKSAHNSFICSSVISCEHSGRNATNRKKADIVLKTETGYIPISLKKDGAEIWESADSYAADETKEKILNNISQITIEKNEEGIYRVSPNFAWKATPEQKRDVVFGSDILKDGGAVITKTFCQQSFSIKGSTLEVNVSSIITDEKDVDDVWFILRNDKTRSSPRLGYPGLRVLAVTPSRINKNVLRIK